MEKNTKAVTTKTPIPTRIFETPDEIARLHLRNKKILNDGLHRMIEERNACRDQGFSYAYVGLESMIENRIRCLGGMAGEW
ncbi:hypothetical protein [Collimonas antrihumi]|uniref:hypothetical protein n=1 Tax=Collimonas antrihumi TaxID=1940615 RepID=UPI001B8BAAA4|nr:hypothetical protein [Collimonas antrihumi]